MKSLVAGALSLLFALAGRTEQFLDPVPGEKHLANIRKLTAVPGAENAEAYFSFGEKKLIFQSTRPPYQCDQIFTMNLDGSDLRLVSTGKGRTTCAHTFYQATAALSTLPRTKVELIVRQDPI